MSETIRIMISQKGKRLLRAFPKPAKRPWMSSPRWDRPFAVRRREDHAEYVEILASGGTPADFVQRLTDRGDQVVYAYVHGDARMHLEVCSLVFSQRNLIESARPLKTLDELRALLDLRVVCDCQEEPS